MLAMAACVLIGILAADSTPARPISQLVHTSWTAKDGAPTEIRALAQTTDGYLWLGTMAGLVRFDGVRFVPFTPRGGDTLPTGGIRRMLATRDGSLWIVWRTGGVSRIRAGRIATYGELDGLAVAFQLAESSTGTLVAGTTTGLARFADGKWNAVSREWQFPESQTMGVWFDREDALWAQTENRVLYRPDGGQQFLDPGMPLTGGPYLTDFDQAQDGTIWMAELSRSAHTVNRVGDRSRLTEVKVGALALLIDRKGSLWIGTAGDGLRRVTDPARIRGQSIARFGPEAEQFTQKDGLLADLVYALLEDREGNIWVSTSRGLERFREGAFTPVPTPGSVRPRVVFAGPDSSVWTATYNVDALIRFGPRGRDSLGPSGFMSAFLALDSTGGLWTIHDSVIVRVQGHRASAVPLRRIAARELSDITVDPAGTVWVFDDKVGLLRLAGDSLVPVAPIAQMTLRNGKLFSDRQGRIWVGQANRVALHDQGRLTVFTVAEGRAPSGVTSFFEDRGGGIWAVGEGGLSKFAGDRFHTLPERQGVPRRSVYGVAEDEAGAWWMVTLTGILRLPPGEMDRAWADSSYSVRFRRFDQLDGIPGIITHGWGSMVTRSAEGRIWVATDSGVASVDPRHLPVTLPPPVLIEAVRIDGRELVLSEPLVLPAKGRDLEIDYTAPSLAMPERLQFRYQLEGEDPEWREVGTRRRAYYTGLGPGWYRFRVIASNGDGVWSEAGTALSFRVLPAWYQTFWFRGVVLLLIIGFGAVTAALVQRRRHLREQQVLIGRHEATLAERARIAQDLHDTLLQGIAGVSMQLKAAERALPDEPDVAAETLIRVQRLTRETLREARERVMDLHEPDLGHDLPRTLENDAQGLLATSGIAFSLRTLGEPRRLPRSHEVAAILIGREAIANAVRHAEARNIEVVVEFEPAALRLEVRDDGSGFTPEQGERAGRQGHLGLTGMRNRAARLGGACEVRSGQEGGTVVTVDLPLA